MKFSMWLQRSTRCRRTRRWPPRLRPRPPRPARGVCCWDWRSWRDELVAAAGQREQGLKHGVWCRVCVAHKSSNCEHNPVKCLCASDERFMCPIKIIMYCCVSKNVSEANKQVATESCCARDYARCKI